MDWSWPCIYFPAAELSVHPRLHPPQQTPSRAEQVSLCGFSFWKDRLEEKIVPAVHKRDKRKWSREKRGKGETKEPQGVCSRCVWRVDTWVRGLQNAEIVIADSSYSPHTWKYPSSPWFHFLNSQHQGRSTNFSWVLTIPFYKQGSLVLWQYKLHAFQVSCSIFSKQKWFLMLFHIIADENLCVCVYVHT